MRILVIHVNDLLNVKHDSRLDEIADRVLAGEVRIGGSPTHNVMMQIFDDVILVDGQHLCVVKSRNLDVNDPIFRNELRPYEDLTAVIQIINGYEERKV